MPSDLLMLRDSSERNFKKNERFAENLRRGWIIQPAASVSLPLSSTAALRTSSGGIAMSSARARSRPAFSIASKTLSRICHGAWLKHAVVVAVIGASLAGIFGSSQATAAEATPITRVSVATGGQEGNGRSDLFATLAALSADGRYVSFISRASNLVADDTNGSDDVFRRDIQTGTTIRVSVGADGSQANGSSGSRTAISADGRYVAFLSFATNLVAGGTDASGHVFVKDLATGTITQVDVSSSGQQASSSGDWSLSLSADGRKVLFQSEAPELDPAVQLPIQSPYCFVRDLDGGTTTMVEVDNSGAPNRYPYYCALSADGRSVAFQGGWEGQESGIYIRNLATSTTTLAVPMATNCGPGGSFGGCTYGGFGLSADGSYLAFETNAPNLTSQTIPTCDYQTFVAYCWEVYVMELSTGRVHLASATDDGGVIADAQSFLPDAGQGISADGRYVAFTSLASNLKTAGGGRYDVYRHDVHTGQTVQLTATTDSSGQGNDSSYLFGDISADGSSVVFTSKSPDLVANDHNGVGDIFEVGRTLDPGDGDGFPAAPSTGWSLPGPTTTYGNANPAVTTRVCQAGDPVNLATGNLFETVRDMDVNGRGRNLDLNRTYNVLAAAAGSSGRLGFGWSDAYASSLTTDVATGLVTVHQGNGSTVTFRPGGSGYEAAAWVRSTLVRNPDGTFTHTLPDQTADIYAPTGQLLRQTDQNGYITTLNYGDGRLTSVTDPAGRSLTFSYDASGHLSEARDPIGRTVDYGYDSAANLVTVTDVGGGITRYEYDEGHRLTATVDPRGGRTENTFDTSGRVISQRDRRAGTMTFSYSGQTTTVTDQAGNVSTHVFDAAQNCVSISRGVGTPAVATWTYTYDPIYQTRLTVTDPNGHTTRARWDARGNPVVRTDPFGRMTRYTYDRSNHLTSITDPLGAVTTLSYDGHGNLTRVARPLAGTAQISAATLVYDPTHPGDVTSSTDPMGKTTNLSYDAAGNVASVSDPSGGRTTYGYNGIGWRTAITAPRGNLPGANAASFTTTVAFNAFGNPTSVTDPLGGTSSTAYDANQNRIAVTDADGHTTTWTFDAADEPTGMTAPNGAASSTTYTTTGDIATQVDPLGHATSYSYDPLRRPTAVTEPLGRTTTYGYDKNGNLTTLRDPLGRTTSFGYDAANRRSSVTYSDGLTPNVSFGYDAVGQRTSMTDGSGTSTFVYDSLHRLTSATSGNHTTVTYGYDLAGHLTSIGYPSALLSLSAGGVQLGAGTVSRAYDDAGRLSSVTDWLGKTTTFAYDPDGNQVGTTYPNGTSETATYDAADRLAQLTDSGANGVFLNLPYTRDAAGMVTSDNLVGTTPAVPQTYTYDSANRLTATGVGPAAAGVAPKSYAYDAANDITSIATAGLTDKLAYDVAGQLATRTGADQSTTTFAYDADGNRLSSLTRSAVGTNISRTYAYDQANRLVAYSGPAMNAVNQQTTSAGPQFVAVHYAYDGDGLRSDLIWDRAEGLPVPLIDSANPPVVTITNVNAYITGPAGLPLERLDPTNGVLYYHHDQLGSTRALTNKDGHVVQRYTYDPYGNTLSSASAIANPFQFAGQYTDFASGLIYLRARWYDPKTAQFLTKDPASALTRTPYNYASDDPINLTDPTGLFDLTTALKWSGLYFGVLSLAFAGLSFYPLLGTFWFEELLGMTLADYGAISNTFGAVSTAMSGAVALSECPGPNCAADVAEAAGGAASWGVGKLASRLVRPVMTIGSAILGVVFDLAAFADSPCPGGGA